MATPLFQGPMTAITSLSTLSLLAIVMPTFGIGRVVHGQDLVGELERLGVVLGQGQLGPRMSSVPQAA